MGFFFFAVDCFFHLFFGGWGLFVFLLLSGDFLCSFCIFKFVSYSTLAVRSTGTAHTMHGGIFQGLRCSALPDGRVFLF